MRAATARGARKLGVCFVTENHTLEGMVKFSKAADRAGFDSAWVAEHYFYRDGLVAASAILSHAARLRIGTAIVNPYTRHPALLAMSIATLDEMSSSGAILGLGVGLRHIVETNLGLEWRPTLRVIGEAVEILKLLLEGKEVTYSGSVFSVARVRLWPDRPKRRIPIFIGAVGPKMLQLAGQVADGVLLTAGCSPRYLQQVHQNLRLGLSRSGRKEADLEVAPLILLAVEKDEEEAREKVRPWLSQLFSRPARALQMLGEQADLDRVSRIQTALSRYDLEAASKLVTDAMVDAMSVAGTPDQCVEGIWNYIRVGATLPIILSVDERSEETLKFVANLPVVC